MTYQPYKWGQDTATTRASARDLVQHFITNEIDNGPGWVITHAGDAYDIHITVTLVKK